MNTIARCRVNEFAPINNKQHCARVSAVAANNNNPHKCGGCPSPVKFCAVCVLLCSNPLIVASAGENYCEYHRIEGNHDKRVPNHQRFSDYEPMNINDGARQKIGDANRAIHAERERLVAEEKPEKKAAVFGADDDSEFSRESAGAFVREYFKASRRQKPSIRRMYEAIIYLVKTVDPKKRRVAVVARAISSEGDGMHNVISKLLSLSNLVEAGWQLVRRAEASGKRVSLEWLADTAGADRKSVQPLAIRAKARKLGVKL